MPKRVSFPRNEVLSVRLTTQEMESLKEKAEKSGLTVSSFVHLILSKAL